MGDDEIASHFFVSHGLLSSLDTLFFFLWHMPFPPQRLPLLSATSHLVLANCGILLRKRPCFGAQKVMFWLLKVPFLYIVLFFLLSIIYDNQISFLCFLFSLHRCFTWKGDHPSDGSFMFDDLKNSEETKNK